VVWLPRLPSRKRPVKPCSGFSPRSLVGDDFMPEIPFGGVGPRPPARFNLQVHSVFWFLVIGVDDLRGVALGL
jgi:hypothetical protein